MMVMWKSGNFDDKIVQETGVLPGENLVLDVTTEFNLVLDGIGFKRYTCW